MVENAILAPDSAHKVGRAEVSRWRVDAVYRAGRQVFLSCTYASRPPLTVQVARPVRECRYTEAGRRRSLRCS